MNIEITDIQRFCMHDGPGLRTTVFFKGCPLRCFWCHNPETRDKGSQLLFYSTKCIGCGICFSCLQEVHRGTDVHDIDRNRCILCGICVKNCPAGALEMVGETVTTDKVMAEVLKDAAFYGEKGGITLSGGEPMMQPAAVLDLARKAKEACITTALETCGYFNEEYIPHLVSRIDFFLWDIKDTDEVRHKQNTGVGTEKILYNLKKVDDLGGNTLLRCIMIKGINMNEEHFNCVVSIFKSLQHCRGVELLPYHPYGDSKRCALGLSANGKEEMVPTREELREAKNYFKSKGVPVIE